MFLLNNQSMQIKYCLETTIVSVDKSWGGETR